VAVAHRRAPAALADRGHLLGEVFEARADADGEREALTDGRRRMTWSEYRHRAGRLASALRDAGVGPGDRVAVHLPKSADTFAAVQAVLRLGAVMVPVDWSASHDYAVRVITAADVTAVLSAVSGDRRAPFEAIDGVRAVVDPSSVDDDGPIAPLAAVGAADPAYIIFTSGSTGEPKGIVHSHASALAYARRAADVYELTADDRLANIAPLHFDQSTFELYAAPVAGAATIVVPDGVLRFPASVSALVARERATVWYSVPFAITQLVTRGALDERDLHHLRWVLFGGESFPPASLAEAMHRLPHARFSNVYGPAEVNQCTFHHLDASPRDDQPIPIGHPWANTSVLLVDDSGAPVTDGQPGELLVSTDTMMTEYFRRPDLTAAAIVERTDDSETRRWYRTGDLVRTGERGLVFVGRIDHQVKIRGYRIELEAVEAVVNEHPDVQACAVLVEGSGDRLVAVVAPPPSPEVRAVLESRLQRRLPRYAVPAEIIGVGALPRTGTGKVDRRAARAALTLRHGDR
jgi:amino acid adenylation domain-containing protein